MERAQNATPRRSRKRCGSQEPQSPSKKKARGSTELGSPSKSSGGLSARDDMGSPVKKGWIGIASESASSHSDKVVKHVEKKAAQGSLEMCAICLEEHNAASLSRAVPCAHCFCTGCIGEWASKCTQCPLCKREMVALQAPRRSSALSTLLTCRRKYRDDDESSSEDDDEDSQEMDQVETELPWVRGARNIHITLPEYETRVQRVPLSRESRRVKPCHTV